MVFKQFERAKKAAKRQSRLNERRIREEPERETTEKPARISGIFNLESIYYFPSCSGGNDFTPSLLYFALDIWKPGENSQMKKQGMLVAKFEFNSD